jgi:hypothetical protein
VVAVSPAEAAAPTCATVPASIIQSALGMPVQSIGSGSGSQGGRRTYLECDYASLPSEAQISIYYYSSSPTESGWKLFHGSSSGGWHPIAEIGTDAGWTTSSFIAHTHGQRPESLGRRVITDVWVFVRGAAIFSIEIQAPSVSLAPEEALAKRMVRIIAATATPTGA